MRRLRSPQASSAGGTFKNAFLIVAFAGLVCYSQFNSQGPSLSNFVPQMELTPDETSADAERELEQENMPIQQKLDAKSEQLLQDAQAARREAEDAKAEAERLKLQVAQAKQEAEKAKEELKAKSSTTGDKKPLNVIVFYPDDWGGRDVQDVNPLLKTPTFSELAKQGIRFTHNAVTTSICWISRANFFTGQYVSTHKSAYLYRPTFASDPTRWAKTWPYLLQQAGYFVGHIGKWQYRGGPYKNKIFNFSSYFEGWTVMNDKEKPGGKIYNADVAKDETIRFLRERPKDQPFATTVAFYPPKGIHKIHDVKPEFATLYQNITHPEAYDRTMAYNRLPSFLQNNDTEARKRYLYQFVTHGDFQETMSAQYATLTHIDSMVGEVIEELKIQGVYDNTLIIVTADNGEFHGAHALSNKWYPYSESIHVPLIIKDPRMSEKKKGTLDYSFTLNIDLAETILGAAGIEPPKEMEGRDIADLYLDNPTSAEPWREDFYYEFPRVNDKIPASTALVGKDWKYIDWLTFGHEELFDMKNDPFELNDVANRSEHAALKAELKHRMELLKHDVYYPRVPNSRCDPLQPSGSDRTKLPNCSAVFPDRCCPSWFHNQMTR